MFILKRGQKKESLLTSIQMGRKGRIDFIWKRSSNMMLSTNKEGASLQRILSKSTFLLTVTVSTRFVLVCHSLREVNPFR